MGRSRVLEQPQAGAVSSPLVGKGLFLAPRALSMGQVTSWVQTAHSWGMDWVHPLIRGMQSDYWYNLQELGQMKRAVDERGLRMAPVVSLEPYERGREIAPHLVTAEYVQRQVSELVPRAMLFGSVLLDLSKDWVLIEDPSWTRFLGQLVRQSYQGKLYPILGANLDPGVWKLPVADVVSWCDGWLPFIGPESWREPVTGRMPGGTSYAIRSAYDVLAEIEQQWDQLRYQVMSRQGASPEVLPVLSLERRELPLPEQEVLRLSQLLSQRYAYIGYYQGERVAPYARLLTSPPVRDCTPREEIDTQRNTAIELPVAAPGGSERPEQRAHVAVIEIEDASLNQMTPLPEVSLETLLSPLLPIIEERQVSLDFPVSYAMSEADVLVVWHKNLPNAAYDEKDTLTRVWRKHLESGLDFPGSPTGLLQRRSELGIDYEFLPCEQGTIYRNTLSGRIFVR